MAVASGSSSVASAASAVASGSSSSSSSSSASASAAEFLGQMMGSLPGIRFHPTDEELVLYYLKRKICRMRMKLELIREIDVYKWDPEDLPGLSILRSRDRQWYFFSPRDRKYPNGVRTNRATGYGFWKATGKDRVVTCDSRTVGLKKTLVFYRGRSPNGARTDWVMHEYTMHEEELGRCQGVQDYFALYKLFKKSGPGPKNGEQYGAPYKEEEWADDDFISLSDLQQLNEVTAVNNVPVPENGPMQPLLDETEKTIMLDPALDLHVNDYSLTPEVVAEDNTQSAVIFPEPNRMFLSSGQPCDVQVQPNFDFAQSVSSPLHVYEAPEVTSAPNIQREVLNLPLDDFLEIDDLAAPDRSFSAMEEPVEILQFGDGFNEFEQYHDAEMFLNDMMGPIEQGTFSHPFMNTFDSNIVNQDYQLAPNQEDANQTGDEFWMHGQRDILSPAEDSGSFSRPTPGVVYESTSLPTEGNENRSSAVGDVATSRVSSVLWAFVESIPTTPASACESALANQTFGRMSSFNRVRIDVKQTNVALGNGAATMKRAGRKGVSFLFFPILVALFAFLWVSVGTIRLCIF